MPAWLDLNADETAADVVLPVEVRVKQGMALLDEKHGPDWVQRIDVDTLDLMMGCDCVLGQLYADYKRGCADLGIDAYPTNGEGSQVDNGFYAARPTGDYADENYNRRWDELTTAWKHAILARRMEQA